VKIGAGGGVLVMRVVGPDHVRGHDVVQFTCNHQERCPLVVLKIDVQRMMRVQRGEGDSGRPTTMPRNNRGGSLILSFVQSGSQSLFADQK
jgi:hypothetical protein